MFISKEDLVDIKTEQEIQRQVSLYLLKIITIILRTLEITPEKLADLMQFKEPAYLNYVNKLMEVLDKQGEADVIKTMTGLVETDERLDK